jgi:predicted RNase H-like HicB family nuclease
LIGISEEYNMSGFDNIEKALGAEPVKSFVVPPHAVLAKVDPVPLTDEKLEKDLKTDYEVVRENLKELVDMGKNALDGVIAVAQEGDQPRAYEVVALMIKTLADTNKELLDLHNKVKSIRKIDQSVTNNTTTNQSIYVGSTKELQDIINSARSSTKAFNNRPDVLESIVEDKNDEQ